MMVAEHEPPAEDTPAEQTMVIHDVRLEQKFTQVPYEVVFMRGLSRDAKHTYTVLLSYAWKHNRCFPGMVRLCEDLGASEPTARKFLRELQDCRLIRIQRRGLQRTNLYHLLPVADAYVPERAAVEVWLRSTLQHINKRAARLGAQGTLALQDWNELCDRHGNMCLICGAREKLVPDHVMPLAKGGLNVIAYIQPICDGCNKRKRDTVADHRLRPDRKLVSFPEQTPVFVQDQTGVCTQDATPGFTTTKDEVDTEGSIPRGSNTTASAVGADAPRAATQKQPRATKAPTPKRDEPAAVDTADLPYRLSEAILLAADRPATRRSVLKIISAVTTEVIDAYRGQGVMFTDAKACLSYMQTHPDYAGLKAKWITWEALAKELGPWLKAGKPAQYAEPVRAKTQATPPRFVPSMIPVRPKTKEEQEWDALVAARDAKRAAEAQATGGVP